MRAQEFVSEKINADTIDPDFKIRKVMKNGMIIQARGKKIWPDMPDERGVAIEIFDPKKDPDLRWPVADVNFKARQDPETGEWYMYSLSTGTKEAYRRQGLASAMYNFARMLGNDVRPSRLQTQAGSDFWKKGAAGQGRYLDLDDEPQYQAPAPEPEPEPQPQTRSEPNFWQRWRRILSPNTKATT